MSFHYIGFVAAREHIIKKHSFLNKASWVKHIADLPKREKIVYLRRFPDRLAKIRVFLEHIKWFNNPSSCNDFVNKLSPAILITDPKLDPYIDYPRKIHESKVTRRHEKILALLADNVAYYTYWATIIRRKPQLLEQILK